MRTDSAYQLPSESLEERLYPFGQKLEIVADLALAFRGWTPKEEPADPMTEPGAKVDQMALDALSRAVEMLREEWGATHAAIYACFREAVRAGGNTDRVLSSMSLSATRQPEAIVAD